MACALISSKIGFSFLKNKTFIQKRENENEMKYCKIRTNTMNKKKNEKLIQSKRPKYVKKREANEKIYFKGAAGLSNFILNFTCLK